MLVWVSDRGQRDLQIDRPFLFQFYSPGHPGPSVYQVDYVAGFLFDVANVFVPVQSRVQHHSKVLDFVANWNSFAIDTKESINFSCYRICE